MYKISIISSLFNSDLYSVKRCFESLYADPFFPLCEFIVVDDTNNPDDVIDYVKYSALKYENICFISNTNNLGLTKSLNLAIKIASSELITRIDFDDCFYQHRLETMFNYFTENQDCVLTFTSYILVLNKSETRIMGTSENLKFKLLYTNPIVHSTVTFRKCIKGELILYNEDFRTSQDLELWSRLIELGDFYCFSDLFSVRREILLSGISLSKRSFLQARNSFVIRLKFLRIGNFYYVIPIIFVSFIYQIFSTIRLYLILRYRAGRFVV